MQKDKTEELKNILNQTLSSEDIEKKLKQETKNIKKEQEKNKSFNLMIYLISAIAILLLIIAIYLFTKDTSQAKNKPKEDIVTKIETPVKNPKIDEKKNKEKNLEKKEIIKKETIIKEVILEKSNFKKYYNSLKFNTLKCYNFKIANPKPDNSCITQLKPFLEKNKDAIRFEVIPVMAEIDNKLFEGMKKTLDTNDKKYIQKVKEYMLRGLSRQRVLEVSWHIKEILGEDIILTPTNYYVKSVKNNKGVIVRAYH